VPFIPTSKRLTSSLWAISSRDAEPHSRGPPA
jgi:hypothetical protein